MKKVISIALLITVFAAPSFACDKPTAPGAMPDGKTAAKEEMMAAKKTVDAFKSDMEEYMACEKNSSKLDRAQDELEKVANRFNEQVRAFKAKG